MMPTEFEDLGVTVTSDGRVSCGEKELQCPTRKVSSTRFRETVLLTMDIVRGDVEPDFEVDDRRRNLIRIDPSCQLLWISEAPPGEQSHGKVYVVNDRIVTETSEGGFAEIDPGTGEVIDSWGATTFRIGGRTIEFDDPIQRVVESDGTTVVHTGPSGFKRQAFYAFDQSGDRLWERSGDKGWHLMDADCFKLMREKPRDNYQIARLDPETGKINEVLRGPESLLET